MLGRKRIYEDNSEKCKAYRERKKLEKRAKWEKEKAEYRARVSEEKLSGLSDTEKDINAVNKFLKEESDTVGTETVRPENMNSEEFIEYINEFDPIKHYTYFWFCDYCKVHNLIWWHRCRCGKLRPIDKDDDLEEFFKEYPNAEAIMLEHEENLRRIGIEP
jgi:hypothetical protein